MNSLPTQHDLLLCLVTTSSAVVELLSLRLGRPGQPVVNHCILVLTVVMYRGCQWQGTAALCGQW